MALSIPLFNFDNYQIFLRAYIDDQPKKGWGFAGRAAEQLGIQPAHLSQVIKGEKDFSPEQALKFSSYIHLSPIETDYFLVLVQKARAGTDDLTNYYDGKIQEIRKQALNLQAHVVEAKTMSPEEKAQFYSNYLYSAVRLFTSLGDGKSFDEIQKHFQVPPLFLRTILGFLTDNDLCVRLGDRYKMGSRKTFSEKGSPAYFKHSTNWRLQGIQKMEMNRKDDLFITSTMSMSLDDVKVIHEKILSLVNQASEKVKNSKPEELICLNIDYFRF